MFAPVLGASILKRAHGSGALSVGVHDLRDWSADRHKTTDDAPFGGGAGMVMKPEPFFAAVEQLRCAPDAGDHLIMLCGHYEGVDERVRQHLATHVVSIGDYVLTGGEIPAMVVIDAVVRLLPGVLGAEESALTDSFAEGLLGHPQYTRPADFRGWKIPEVLLSGHHEQIRRWRRKEALRRTRQMRPDLLERAELTAEDADLLAEVDEEEAASR
jgi:tRNA (guanine37-N1)-methyltransferase